MIITLLKLPRELRDLVYCFCLTNYHDPYHRYKTLAVRGDTKWLRFEYPNNDISDTLATISLQDDHIRLSLNLLLTCHQVYIEANPHLYSRNTFCFSLASRGKIPNDAARDHSQADFAIPSRLMIY